MISNKKLESNQIFPSLKISILAEILPSIKELYGMNIVIKYGGNAMIDINLQNSFAYDVMFLKSIGLNPIIVHGGAPQIEDALRKMGKKSEFIDGIRITDIETMKIVEWVLSGEVQQQIVGTINKAGGKAIGLTGKDGKLIQAKKKITKNKSNTIDIGFVGEITSIDLEPVKALQNSQFIPVISPIGYGENGETYNINADVVAANLAKILKAKILLLITNVPGVLGKSGSLLTKLSFRDIEYLLEDGTISGGMIPKIRSSLDATKNGVGLVHIIDGRVEHCLLSAIFFDSGKKFGTRIAY